MLKRFIVTTKVLKLLSERIDQLNPTGSAFVFTLHSRANIIKVVVVRRPPSTGRQEEACERPIRVKRERPPVCRFGAFKIAFMLQCGSMTRPAHRVVLVHIEQALTSEYRAVKFTKTGGNAVQRPETVRRLNDTGRLPTNPPSFFDIAKPHQRLQLPDIDVFVSHARFQK